MSPSRRASAGEAMASHPAARSADQIGESVVRLNYSERHTAQLISQAERGVFRDDLNAGLGRQALILGITGPPGSGKSTLVDVLARAIRKDGFTVAILAIDPSSNATGGAVLGDRIRMSSHAQDPGTFIRSMGTRGSTTGLAEAAHQAVRILEAAGYDVVIVETVGVGQVELDVLTIADTVTVVLVPGLGDTMQMNKAGIMEIGDVFVVNMSDRPETPRFVRELKQALALGAHRGGIPPVCLTTALSGQGVAGLWATISGIATDDRQSGALASRRGQQRTAELEREVERRVHKVLRNVMSQSAGFRDLREQVRRADVSPRAAADEWMQDVVITAD